MSPPPRRRDQPTSPPPPEVKDYMPRFMDFHDDLKLPPEAIEQIAQRTRDGAADEFGVRQIELYHNAAAPGRLASSGTALRASPVASVCCAGRSCTTRSVDAARLAARRSGWPGEMVPVCVPIWRYGVGSRNRPSGSAWR